MLKEISVNLLETIMKSVDKATFTGFPRQFF